MRKLKNKDLRWLQKASEIDNQDKNLIHIEGDFAISTGGFRLHAIHLDKAENEVEGLDIRKIIDEFDSHITVESVTINAHYLLDALMGLIDNRWYYKSIKLSVARNNDNAAMVRLEDDEGHTAIIMCIKDDKDEDEENE